MQTTVYTPFGVCKANAEGFEILMTCLEREDHAAIVLELNAPAPQIPRDVTVEWSCFLPDVYSVFTPDSGCFRALRPDWGDTGVRARSASGLPVMSLLSVDGENCLTVALSDAGEASRIGCGVCEERIDFRFQIALFTQRTTPRTHYRVEIWLDARRIPYTEALQAVRARWDRLYPPCTIPEAALEPVYSCWYSLHQQVTTQDVLAQCRLAAQYGMKTVIVDDGWQTDDNSRGYAYCGDWQTAKSKIPDMAALVRQVHALGMRFMLWYAVPLIGKNSRVFRRFEGKFLDTMNDSGCCTLDPRYPECRAFLRDTYIQAAKAWDLDGLKLDFIDSFRLTEFSNTDAAGMDCVNPETAVQQLLQEVTDALRAFKPDFLVEFRQSYVGPVMRRFGNILRVGDCPDSALSNRNGSLTLRLLSGETAVHSDMIEWNSRETQESAAMQLAAVLFSVPQISVRLETLPQAHRDMLRFYLDFWRSRREILLHGVLTADAPQANFARACAVLGDAGVAVLYERRDVTLQGCREWDVVNAAGAQTLFVQTDRAFDCTVCTCTGETVRTCCLKTGLHALQIPAGGMAFFRA